MGHTPWPELLHAEEGFGWLPELLWEAASWTAGQAAHAQACLSLGGCGMGS